MNINRIAGMLALIAFPLLTACSEGDDNLSATEAEKDAVTVAFAMPTVATTSEGIAVTRASAGTIDNEGVATNATALTDPSLGGFGVFGCYTGLHRYADSNVKPNFMYNEHITFNSTTNLWEYYPVKYWPNGEGNTLPEADPEASGNGTTAENPHYISFFAYAPYSDNDSNHPDTNPAGYCIPTFSYQLETTNPWLYYRLIPQDHLNKQVDLLCAVPLLNQKKPQISERLHFQFMHALACVANTITIECSDALKKEVNAQLGKEVSGTTVQTVEVIITGMSILYELTDHGRLTLWNNGIPKWDAVMSGDFTTSRRIDYTTMLATNNLVHRVSTGPVVEKSSWIDDMHGIFYIPMHIGHHPQTATMTIEYEVRYYTVANPTTPVKLQSRSVNSSVTLSSYPDAYQAGKCLNFKIQLLENPLPLAPIVSPKGNNAQLNITGYATDWKLTAPKANDRPTLPY
jgi:hypothetical protein